MLSCRTVECIASICIFLRLRLVLVCISFYRISQINLVAPPETLKPVRTSGCTNGHISFAFRASPSPPRPHPQHPAFLLLHPHNTRTDGRRVQPRYIIQSGIRTSLSIRFARLAAPDAKIVVAPPQYTSERFANVTYIVRKEYLKATQVLAAEGTDQRPQKPPVRASGGH